MANKIVFIICTNKEDELSECLYYLNQINIPSGFEVEVVTITDAKSMTSGYNEGMKESDAKYKIYLHQDLLILNKDIILDIVTLFQQNEWVGLIGCIGCRKMPENAYAITAWDTGKILHNSIPNEKFEYQNRNGNFVEVDAVDGCFIATQYDIPWREDLFDGWDFYDISQCFEFHRLGKAVIVPYQKTPWCYHDNSFSNMESYHRYRNIFAREYQDVFPFSTEFEIRAFSAEYSALIVKIKLMIEKLIDSGDILQTVQLFDSSENRGYLALKEYELFADIYHAELNFTGIEIFKQGMNAGELLQQLKLLKHLVKRVEFRIGNQEDTMQSLLENFSLIAINKAVLAYCIDKDEVWQRISCWQSREGESRQSF